MQAHAGFRGGGHGQATGQCEPCTHLILTPWRRKGAELRATMPFQQHFTGKWRPREMRWRE